MKKLIAAVSILMSSTALADTAVWTGNVEYVTTITGRAATKCEYTIYGRAFWRLFEGQSTCPSTVEVE